MGCFVVPVTAAVTAGCASSRCKALSAALRRLALCETAVGLCSAAEHAWHGEISLAWPFLTFADGASLARELATEGVALALAGVASWGVWEFARVVLAKRRAALREA